MIYADDTASTFVNVWVVLLVVIFAVSIVKPVPATYPVPAFVTVIALISPLLFKVGTAVATLLPVVGSFIVIVGKSKYLCFAFTKFTLDIVPVVSCGKASVISCGSVSYTHLTLPTKA